MITFTTVVYLIIAAIVFVSTLYNLFRAEKVLDKICCAMILVPLALRLLLIK